MYLNAHVTEIVSRLGADAVIFVLLETLVTMDIMELLRIVLLAEKVASTEAALIHKVARQLAYPGTQALTAVAIQL